MRNAYACEPLSYQFKLTGIETSASDASTRLESHWGQLQADTCHGHRKGRILRHTYYPE